MKKKISLISSNSGSATITVIVTMLLVVALGAALLFAAYTSYKVTLMQRQDRENLYTAENAMDDIRSGIQSAVSEALAAAYTETLTEYAKNEAADPQKTFSEKINNKLSAYKIAQINESFYDESARTYNANALKSFISGADEDDKVGAAGSFGDDVRGSVLVTADDTGAITELCFRQVSLHWVENGFESNISADIVVSIPGFSGSLGDYAIVAGGGIGVGGETGLPMNATVTGNIYSGGDIEAGINSSLELKGTAYVADDLILSGASASVVLTGEYYGYGGSTTVPGESSAILVNGKNASLDLSGLKRLYLAGFSFINAAGAKDELAGVENPQVQMGQSMAFKANQLAYLAPVECITNYASNPFVLRTIPDPNGGEPLNVPAAVNNDAVLWGSEKLSDYGGTMTLYRNDLNIGYVFMRFSSKEKANDYFRLYFGKYPDRIKQYLDFYLTLNTSATSEVVTEGNAFYTEAGELKLMPATGGAQVMGQRFSDFVKSGALSELGENESLEFEQGGKKVLVVNGSYSYSGTAPEHYSLVISSGDVTVSGEITGCVLAAGKVTLCTDAAPSAKLTAAALPAGILGAFATAHDGTSYQLSDFLRESYGGDGAQGENAWSSDKLVSYQNWRKN